MDGVTTSIIGSSAMGAASAGYMGYTQAPRRTEQKERRVERKTRDMH